LYRTACQHELFEATRTVGFQGQDFNIIVDQFKIDLPEYGMQLEQDALSANDSLSEDEEYIMHETAKDIKERQREKLQQEQTKSTMNQNRG
jgi:hypothetical protein